MSRDNGSIIGVSNQTNASTASGVWSLSEQTNSSRNRSWPGPDQSGAGSVQLLLSGEGEFTNWLKDSSSNNAQALIDQTYVSPSNFSPFSIYGHTLKYTNPNSIGGLTVSANGNLDMGTGDFTIECWVNCTELPTSNTFTTSAGGYQAIFGTGPNNSVTGTQLYIGATTIKFDITGDGSGPINIDHGMYPNTWYHIALTRSGNTFRIYKDGILLQSGTSSASWVGGYAWGIMRSEPSGGYTGTWWYGSISNFRVLKGVALYTASVLTRKSFIINTVPLRSVSSTSLLVCQSNVVLDNGPHNISVSADAGVTISSLTLGTESVDDANYGSGYFNGGAGSPPITYPTNSAYSLGSSLYFTVEYCVYLTGGFGAETSILERFDGTGGPGWVLCKLSNNKFFFGWSGGTQLQSTTTANLGCWYHVCAMRNNDTAYLFINGVLEATAAIANFTDGSSDLALGERVSGSQTFPFTGYVSNVRIVKSSTSNGLVYNILGFSPPTQPLTAITGTVFLGLQYNQGNNNSGFLDNSTNKAQVVRVGNATQGSFTPFNNPTGSWSNYFNGGSNHVIVPASAAHEFRGFDFTVEFFWYVTNTSARQWFIHATTDYWFGIDCYYSGNGGYFCVWASSNGSSWNIFDGDSVGANGVTGAIPIPNAWNHIAVSRSGSTWAFFLNGTRRWTATSSATIVARSSQQKIIGGWANGSQYKVYGYMSNFRQVIGDAVYRPTSTTITVPTSPLTVFKDTFTRLLTLQSNRLVDNSSDNHALTVSGRPAAQLFSPFATSPGYIKSSMGGSAFLDGSGDYLTVPSNETGAFNFGTGAFTIEGWFFANTNYSTGVLTSLWGVSQGGGGAQKIVLYDTSSGVLGVDVNGGVAFSTSNIKSLLISGWTHIALVRDGTGSNQSRVYVNGIRVGVGTISANFTGFTARFHIGHNSELYQNPFPGNINSFRVVKGIAVYSGTSTTAKNFELPTGVLKSVQIANPYGGSNTAAIPEGYTSLLHNFTNAGVYDLSGRTSLESVRQQRINSNISKYGGTGLEFVRTITEGSYLVSSDLYQDPYYEFGSGKFTIEAWVYLAVNTSSFDYTSIAPIVQYGNGGANGPLGLGTTWGMFIRHNSGTPGLGLYRNIDFSGDWQYYKDFNFNSVTEQWCHVAITRSESVLRFFVNGTSIGTANIGSLSYTHISGSNQRLWVGIMTGGGGANQYYRFPGSIDDVRVTRGLDRYVTHNIPVSVTIGGSVTTSGGSTSTINAPYGITDNESDAGWYWSTASSSNFFIYDFGKIITTSAIEIYSVWSGGSRGAIWQIQTSADGITYSNFATINYAASTATRYSYDLVMTTRYVKWFASSITATHSPRTATVRFVSSSQFNLTTEFKT